MTFSTVIASFLTAFLALFPVLNPIGDALIVNGFLKELDDKQRKSAIRKIFFNCLLIGMGSLVAGHLILILFDLGVPVIQVGGGLVLCKTGWEWLGDSGGPTQNIPRNERKEIDMNVFEQKLFYPISFPVLMDPGAISVIFTLTATAHVRGDLVASGLNYGVIGLAIVALLIILYIFMAQGKVISRYLGESGNAVINKLVAFLTFCIGIQIIFSGLSKIFNLGISLGAG